MNKNIIECAKTTVAMCADYVQGKIEEKLFVNLIKLSHKKMYNFKYNTDFRVLMSRDNPQGETLEDVLENVVYDLHLKNKHLIESKNDNSDQKKIDIADRIITNNGSIIAMLNTCIEFQKESMEKIEELGPNKGPENPRL